MKCSKIWFPSKKLAKQQRAKIEMRTGKKQRIYKCPICGYYHFTTVKDIKSLQFFRNNFK